jgi:hypothetical protein
VDQKNGTAFYFFKTHLNDLVEPLVAKSIYNVKLSVAIEYWQAICRYRVLAGYLSLYIFRATDCLTLKMLSDAKDF